MDFLKKDYILFDLDGTVVDTGKGIKNGIRFALDHFGFPIKEGDSLDCFIGPPLSASIADYCGISPDETADIISVYREYYSKTGIYECEVYPGIKDLFSLLKENGKVILIATSKPEQFAETVLRTVGLWDFIDALGGATMDGTREKKADIIEYVLEKIGGVDKSLAVLVGDRHYDIDGAIACSVSSVGVLWGYGSKEEFEKAGADMIVADPEELGKLLVN